MHSTTSMKLPVVFMEENRLFMEETREQGIDVNGPRKLNLNLPLLSTRRLGKKETCGATKSQAGLQDTSERIPFCWEHAPGKPKDGDKDDIHEAETPRPRLPPCRWSLQNEAAKNGDHSCIVSLDDHDDGCDADDDGDGEETDVFSDGIDVLSLTELIDIAQKSDDGHRLDRLNLESVNSTDTHPLNFMMERFLPDATALAASSALCAMNNFNRNLPYPYSYSEEYVSRTVGQSHPSEASHKGCGLDVLLPWRSKHKLCGVKSPVRQVSPKLQPHHCSPKQKKLCSLNRPLKDVNKDI
ncbi:hypothetical protein OIU84_025896 [Salix udensis]|uniref:Uncharacterized protein n=1 Tax=Salix udensis TaxID=889485 RepID=A0AAD6KKK3_9ROSI|nr:hypothetical protein OIU84_025896 [Salix udensis]